MSEAGAAVARARRARSGLPSSGPGPDLMGVTRGHHSTRVRVALSVPHADRRHPRRLPARHRDLLEKNLRALQRGYDAARAN